MAESTDGIVEKEENYSEAICALCDNGGDLICCEGKCLRAFHGTVEDGSDSACHSLGFSNEQVEAIETFKCENCLFNQHQCYVCGKLGSSDESTGAEVFQCGRRTCCYFYHPSCVANALHFKYEDAPKDIEAEIVSGKPFVCPLHFCRACKEIEEEHETDLLMQFAVCRRCPVAYHRKCLPGEIAFEYDDDKGIIPRAWEGLIPDKIVIYCMEHVMDDELETPSRDHIKFPYTGLEKEEQAKESVEVKTVPRKVKTVPRKRPRSSEGLKESSPSKRSRYAEKSSAEKQLNKSSVRVRRFSGPYSFRERKLSHASKQLMSARDREFYEKYLLREQHLSKRGGSGSKKDVSGLERRASFLGNNSCSGKNLNGLLNHEDSEATITESSKNICRKKRSNRSKPIAGNNDFEATKLKNKEIPSSEKRSKSSKEVAGNENSEEIALEKKESCASETPSKNCKATIDDVPVTTQKYPSNGNVEPAHNITNSCGIHDSTSSSRLGFKGLGFAPGPYRPIENSSVGWLNE